MQQGDNTKKNALNQRIGQICAGQNAKQFDFLTNKTFLCRFAFY